MNKMLIEADLRLSTPFFASPVAPSSNAFAALFHTVDALRDDQGSVVLLLAGADGHARSADIASGFARTATAATGLATLFVDATGDNDCGPDCLRATRGGAPLASVARPTGEAGIAWAGLGGGAVTGVDVRRLIAAARAGYGFTVIDAGPIGDGPAATAFARHCDATVLVVRAGRTREDALEGARALVGHAGGTLLGTVLDGDEARVPSWLDARL